MALIATDSDPGQTLIFCKHDGPTWATDGTPEGTAALLFGNSRYTIYFNRLTVSGTNLFFSAARHLGVLAY